MNDILAKNRDLTDKQGISEMNDVFAKIEILPIHNVYHKWMVLAKIEIRTIHNAYNKGLMS